MLHTAAEGEPFSADELVFFAPDAPSHRGLVALATCKHARESGEDAAGRGRAAGGYLAGNERGKGRGRHSRLLSLDLDLTREWNCQGEYCADRAGERYFTGLEFKLQC